MRRHHIDCEPYLNPFQMALFLLAQAGAGQHRNEDWEDRED
jgi:hypothetical protein